MKKLALLLDSAGDFRFQTEESDHVYFLKTRRAKELETTIDSLLDTYEEVIALTNNQEYHDANKHMVNAFNGRFMILNLDDEEEIHDALLDMGNYAQREEIPEQSMILHVVKKQAERAQA